MSLTRWLPRALLLCSLLWASTLLTTPYLVSHADRTPTIIAGASLIHLIGSLICHQRPERSFHPWGVQAPVCARCEGIYLAAPFGVAIVFRRRRRGRAPNSRTTWRRSLVLASVPTITTLAWEWSTGDMTSGLVRSLAGAALGLAVAAAVASVAMGELR